MIDLYFFPSPNGLKVAIMLEECGLPYRIAPVNILRGEQFAPEYLRINPNNKIPAIVDHDLPGGPLPVFESGAVLLYLAEKSGRFLPQDTRGRYTALQWLFWQVAGLGPMAGQAHHFRIYAPQKIDYAIERYTNEVNRLYGVMDSRLEDRDYLAGDYSIADMACIGWVRSHEKQGQDLAEFPYLKAWFERLIARPAVAKGLMLGRDDSQSDRIAHDPEAQKVLFGQRARGH